MRVYKVLRRNNDFRSTIFVHLSLLYRFLWSLSLCWMIPPHLMLCCHGPTSALPEARTVEMLRHLGYYRKRYQSGDVSSTFFSGSLFRISKHIASSRQVINKHPLHVCLCVVESLPGCGGGEYRSTDLSPIWSLLPRYVVPARAPGPPQRDGRRRR